MKRKSTNHRRQESALRPLKLTHALLHATSGGRVRGESRRPCPRVRSAKVVHAVVRGFRVIFTSRQTYRDGVSNTCSTVPRTMRPHERDLRLIAWGRSYRVERLTAWHTRTTGQVGREQKYVPVLVRRNWPPQNMKGNPSRTSALWHGSEFSRTVWNKCQTHLSINWLLR